MTGKIIGIALVYIGIAFIIISAIGIIRMPDVYTRMSAVSKAITLGVGFILLGTAFHFNDTVVFIKCTLIFIFLIFSMSVAAHIIGLAAYEDGTELTHHTFLDELKKSKDAPDSHEQPFTN